MFIHHEAKFPRGFFTLYVLTTRSVREMTSSMLPSPLMSPMMTSFTLAGMRWVWMGLTCDQSAVSITSLHQSEPSITSPSMVSVSVSPCRSKMWSQPQPLTATRTLWQQATNQRSVFMIMTNQRQVFTEWTNQRPVLPVSAAEQVPRPQRSHEAQLVASPPHNATTCTYREGVLGGTEVANDIVYYLLFSSILRENAV